MTLYPLKFYAISRATAGIQASWSTQAQHLDHSVPVAIPPEFEGPGTGLSPEDLYAMALENCFVATFKVFAEKSRLHYDSLEVVALLEVDRDDKGRPWMARIDFKVRLVGAAQPENAKRLLERTSQSCMILNSVKTAKTFHFDIVPADTAK